MADNIVAILFSVAGALLFFTVFVYFKKRTDSSMGPATEALTALLPNANCGACGNPGCRELAKRILRGRAAPYACVSGGPLTAARIARFMEGIKDGPAQETGIK